MNVVCSKIFFDLQKIPSKKYKKYIFRSEFLKRKSNEFLVISSLRDKMLKYFLYFQPNILIHKIVVYQNLFYHLYC